MISLSPRVRSPLRSLLVLNDVMTDVYAELTKRKGYGLNLSTLQEVVHYPG